MKQPRNTNSFTDILISAAEKLDWTCELEEYANGNYMRFGKYTPSGEDFSICVSVGTIVEEVRSAADTFDIDEHVFTWLEAARHGTADVPPARVLVEDAEEIEGMLRELANALSRVQENYERSSLAGKVSDAVSRSATATNEPVSKSPSR